MTCGIQIIKIVRGHHGFVRKRFICLRISDCVSLPCDTQIQPRRTTLCLTFFFNRKLLSESTSEIISHQFCLIRIIVAKWLVLGFKSNMSELWIIDVFAAFIRLCHPLLCRLLEGKDRSIDKTEARTNTARYFWVYWRLQDAPYS